LCDFTLAGLVVVVGAVVAGWGMARGASPMNVNTQSPSNFRIILP
jgi:hypothetical protein